jgi:hypothetical protein
MKRTKILATVAMAAVLGIIIATTTEGMFLQQANASDCHIIQGKHKCSNENSFRSNQFNYQGKDGPGQPYLYHEHHGDGGDDGSDGQDDGEDGSN